jgi:hypothetical protein
VGVNELRVTFIKWQLEWALRPSMLCDAKGLLPPEPDRKLGSKSTKTVAIDRGTPPPRTVYDFYLVVWNDRKPEV